MMDLVGLAIEPPISVIRWKTWTVFGDWGYAESNQFWFLFNFLNEFVTRYCVNHGIVDEVGFFIVNV